ncbi:MAG TPA: hypothetical protein VN248_06385 [Arenimonas sp.]|nr:hypothetical protein [Arenimonas sp.]
MWLIIIAAAVGVLAYVLLRGEPSRPVKSKRPLSKGATEVPARTLDPTQFRNQAGVVAWEFLVPNLSTACAYARNNAGVRKSAMDCTVLPLADCGSETCICHYRPVYESRKVQRRQAVDRRESVRFDAGTDRRGSPERRKGEPDWQEKIIK